MKFARYLEDSQTPEWKKAYIDYRGLKKRITKIRKAQQNGAAPDSHEGGTQVESSRIFELGLDQSQRRSVSSRGRHQYGSTGVTPPLAARDASHSPPPSVALPAATLSPTYERSANVTTRPASASFGSLSAQTQRENHISLRRSFTTSVINVDRVSSNTRPLNSQSSGFLANMRRRTSWRTNDRSTSAPRNLPLSVVLPTLTPIERDFFDALDKELEKIENFYCARENEAKVRFSVLKEQLRELQDHRRLFHQVRNTESKWSSLPLPRIVVENIESLTMRASGSAIHAAPRDETTLHGKDHIKNETGNGNGKEPEQPISRESSIRIRLQRDPEEYTHAKKDLKKALLEYYRGLELLNNYRVLNLTGFRKALKKFEKITKASVQYSYMHEKVDICAFASGDAIENMMQEIEVLYAARFEGGDKKKAQNRLRATARHKTHHFSTFRTGLYIGIALPALISGLYQCFQDHVRETIPWDSLLLVYATFLIPVVFSLLVGLNILVWSHSRINYGFIFELDVRTQLDSREYFELPSFCFCTLCYAFWFSFNRIGAHTIAPTTWPLIWLVFTLLVLFNPFCLLFPNSRWWLIRNVGRLFASGTVPVEFTDFWLGDQFCSLIFTLSNLYFVGCAYERQWNNVWQDCSTSRNWGVPFALASLPLLIRAIQSIKRYLDSRLITHLINGGKYIMSIAYYAVYFVWRHHSTPHNYLLVLLCLVGTCYSIYTTSWDILMDWSFFKRSARYPFLRPELMYTSNISLYYVAILTNIFIRFIWVIYIPTGGLNITTRTFIAAFLEMLRRCQWNFFRLENEHIGNTDQYRATREVPLPYSFRDDDVSEDGDDDRDEDEHYNADNGWRRRRSVRLSSLSVTDRQNN